MPTPTEDYKGLNVSPKIVGGQNIYENLKEVADVNVEQTEQIQAVEGEVDAAQEDIGTLQQDVTGLQQTMEEVLRNTPTTEEIGRVLQAYSDQLAHLDHEVDAIEAVDIADDIRDALQSEQIHELEAEIVLKAAANHNHTGTYEPANSNLQAHVAVVSGNPHGTTYTHVGAAAAGHNHDLAYAAAGHNHDGTYEPHNDNIQSHVGNTSGNPHGTTYTHVGAAAAGHNHDGVYAAAGHNHSGVYEPANSNLQSHVGNTSGNPHGTTYTHVGAAAAGHNHDLTYAALGHNHDLAYAALGHNHTGTYEPANSNLQSHVGVVSGNPHGTTYTHVGAAAAGHNHDGVYATAGHNHTGTYEPANSNIQSHISVTAGNPHGTTYGDVGAAAANHTHAIYESVTKTFVRATNTYVVQSGDRYIVCSRTTAMLVALPAATGSGRPIDIKNVNIGEVTVDAYQNELIDDMSLVTLQRWDSVTLIDYAAGQWIVV